jgi:hypothetical protein
MSKPITRTCQCCFGKAVREQPEWWVCHNCGMAWRVGVNPLRAMLRQAKAQDVRKAHGVRDW